MPFSIDLFNTDVKASFGSYGTIGLSLSAETEEAKVEALNNSKTYSNNYFLPLSGGTVSGQLTLLGNVSGRNSLGTVCFQEGQSFAEASFSVGKGIAAGANSNAFGNYSFAGYNSFALGDQCTAGGLLKPAGFGQPASKIPGSNTWRVNLSSPLVPSFGGTQYCLMEGYTSIGQFIRCLIYIIGGDEITFIDFLIIQEFFGSPSSNSTLNNVRIFTSKNSVSVPINACTAMGYFSKAAGDGSTAIGYNAEALGTRSVAMGSYVRAVSAQSVALGNLCTSSGLNGIALGYFCTSNGDQAFSVGNGNIASGLNSVALGYLTRATNAQATAFGFGSRANGLNSTAFNSSLAEGEDSFSAGSSSAIGNSSFAVGGSTRSQGPNSFSAGSSTLASGLISVAMGINSVSNGNASVAVGDTVLAQGGASHANNISTYALGYASHTEGKGTATGIKATWISALQGFSSAEYIFTFTPSDFSNINPVVGRYIGGFSNSGFGGYFYGQILSFNTVTNSISARVFPSFYLIDNQPGYIYSEGSNKGFCGHAEGEGTTSSGRSSHAEGSYTAALGDNSHSAGYGAIALHDRSWIWCSSYSGSSTTRTEQFLVSAGGGTCLLGNVGIGTDNNSNALTVVGTISSYNALKFPFTAAAPSNTTSPTAWLDIYVNDTLYKLPLYQ